MTAQLYTFNRNPIRYGKVVDTHTMDIEGIPNLRRASLPNAALFGGPMVREALEQAPIVGDRKHIIVDTKVSMLMPGWWPAIPGWHTDGVPRGAENDPAGTGNPSMKEQQRQYELGHSPRYHSIIFGNPCLTEFILNPLALHLENGENPELYAEMTRKVKWLIDGGREETIKPRPRQWVSWDWWQIHRATEADKRGWRLLIRVSETDNVPPAEVGFIRAQNQVYVPKEFGW